MKSMHPDVLVIVGVEHGASAVARRRQAAGENPDIVAAQPHFVCNRKREYLGPRTGLREELVKRQQDTHAKSAQARLMC